MVRFGFPLGLLFLAAGAANSFSSSSMKQQHHLTRTAFLKSSEVSTADDLLTPKYQVEPIAIRIGHGFDIHRMVPIQDAGQPVVIAGVVIEHKDQKVNFVKQSPSHNISCCYCFFISSFNL